MKTLPPATALKHVYHAVYLQIFLGAAAVTVPIVAHQSEILPGINARGTGGLMILMGINVYSYLRRYEKTLAANASREPDVA